ncbi:MAG TPA: GFA family protein [Alphaproteobacteria bacterium]|nr:GFA family protein [Alphaproteobacteria bacterium]
MTETWTGGCQCGRVRYEVAPDAVLTLVCCHCRECQRQSASAFGMSMIMPRSAFRLVRGTLKTWERRSDRRTVSRAHFCPNCGVRIFHGGGDADAEISLKPGTLDDTGVLDPVGHLWTRRAQPWVPLPADGLLYEGEPESDDDLYAAYRGGRDR